MPVLLAISAVLVSVISVQCKPSRNTEYYYGVCETLLSNTSSGI